MYLIVDIGSNTVRAVIFKLDNGIIIPVLNRKYSAGLVNYINKRGCMSKDGIDNLVEILTEIKMIIEGVDLAGAYFFATASLRNIANSNAVLKKIKKRTGLDIEVLSGEAEALYDYYATIKKSQNFSPEGMVTDIGGGSTELIVYNERGPAIVESISIGSLNMFNRYVENIIATKSEAEKIYREVLRNLEEAKHKETVRKYEMEVNLLCGVGGSCRSILKLNNQISKTKNRSNSDISVDFLDEIYKGVYSTEELASVILKVAPDRIHTIIPGAMILKAVADYFEVKRITVSTHGVREGFLYHRLEEEGLIYA